MNSKNFEIELNPKKLIVEEKKKIEKEIRLAVLGRLQKVGFRWQNFVEAASKVDKKIKQSVTQT